MHTLIDRTVAYVQSVLKNAEGGHDWSHTYRVWQLAIHIAEKENSNNEVVQLAALLHDIADSKFHNGNETIGPQLARTFLENEKVSTQTIDHVVSIIENISFKGGKEHMTFFSKELAIVQDADRLDALGAIGIARTFNYGGYKNRKIYDPKIRPNLNMTKEEYKNSDAPSINHFYEKLLRLKDRMNTESAKKIAHERHDFILKFLDQFYKEWAVEI
jgi:uncharacterized protein